MIPACDWSGVIPPIDVSEDGVEVRSPIRATIIELIERFASTQERIEILDGFLQFRDGLARIGIVDGFQWIDGSFVEDVERIEKRPPHDIDVVTFFHIPAGASEEDIVQEEIMDHVLVKKRFRTDAYFHVHEEEWDFGAIEAVVYWNSLFSHRRDRIWKGYVQIDLSPELDTIARKKLDNMGGAK